MTLSVVRDMFTYRSRKALGSTSKGNDLQESGETGKGAKEGRTCVPKAIWSSGIARIACTVEFM